MITPGKQMTQPCPAKLPLRRSLAAVLAAAALSIPALTGFADVTVKVDSTKPWAGYMNVFDLSGGYLWGSGWGAADLRADLVPKPGPATRLVLRLNTNNYNPSDAYWVQPDGTPNKNLEANYYVDVSSAFGGQSVTFVGTTETNTIPEGWTCRAFIKEFAPGYAPIGTTTADLVTGQPFTVQRQIGTGNICQYGFVTYGTHVAPNSAASLAGASVLVDNADPGISKQPVNARAAFGSAVNFAVTATGSTALSYHWQREGTNLINAGNIAGADTATLTINNAQAADAASYRVAISNLTGGTITSDTARLRVLSAADFANGLDNPSFELEVTNPTTVPAPWVPFSASMLQNTNDLMAGVDNVPTIQGTNAVQVYNAVEWNGFYQDVPCAPGDIFTGDIWLWQSSWYPLMAPTNEAFLEVQFRRAAGNPIAMYQSRMITNDITLMDKWLLLEATNGVAAGYAQLTTTSAKYLVAPAETVFVRFQVTLHNVGGGMGGVYVDDGHLMKKIPVSVTATRTGAQVQLAWLTQGATSYEVVYKNSLADAAWTPTGTVVTGDGTVKTASFPISGNQRIYNVLTK
jgi:hypothetical protein